MVGRCGFLQNVLRISAEGLFPAALKSHEATTAFQNTVKEYRDAIVIQDISALERGVDEGRHLIDIIPRRGAVVRVYGAMLHGLYNPLSWSRRRAPASNGFSLAPAGR